MYSTSQLGSSASPIMDLINKLIWAIRGRRVCAHSAHFIFNEFRKNLNVTRRILDAAWSLKFDIQVRMFKSWSVAVRRAEALRLCNGKKRSEIPPRPTPLSQSIMISSPALLWESS